jgi:hypothetical protein
MKRERVLQILLVLVGLFFMAGIYPLVTSLWQPKTMEVEPMFLGVYLTLGVFDLLASRNPSANRGVIAFTAWSSIVHAAVMAVQAFFVGSERVHLLSGVALFGIIGVALILLAPPKTPGEFASVARA